MRGKIRGRQYAGWQELVRDFELICSNAMKYNQRRSRVHKQVRGAALYLRVFDVACSQPAQLLVPGCGGAGGQPSLLCQPAV